MKKAYNIWVMLVISICLTLTGCQTKEKQPDTGVEKAQGITTVQFIDTGNSDCILIGNSGEYMMIDGGDNDDEQLLADYLKEQGITKLKYVILTHPDADHCGGLDRVIESVEVGRVFIGNGSAETKTYRDFVQAAVDKGMKPSVPLENEQFTLGTGKLQFFNQTAHYKDVNDNSLVTLYTNGEFKALFTGDAGKMAEENLPLSEIGHVDLLKAGHHGSKTSSSEKFIQAVSPKYVVICCGTQNKYGHPDQETLDTLRRFGVTVYRTDLSGTVTVTQNGKQIEVAGQKQEDKKQEDLPIDSAVSKAPSDKGQLEAAADETVYITASGKKYHRAGCSYLKNGKTAIALDKAESEGYTACSKCQP